jgi:DNA-binding MarR family transcriptional regulator
LPSGRLARLGATLDFHHGLLAVSLSVASQQRVAPGQDDELLAIADRLHSASIHLLRRVRRQDTQTGLTPARLSALSVIVFGGRMTLGDLAAVEQVRPPTMTRLVEGLEREGLVARERDPKDQRVVWVRATARGARIMFKGRQRRVEALSTLLRPLDASDRSTLARAADIVERVLSR